MGYHDLSDSGMSESSMRDEATRICTMLDEHVHRMTNNESDFVGRIRKQCKPVTTKQLFWLRDIKDKYL